MGDTPENQLAGTRQQEEDMDLTNPDSHARRPHPVDQLITPELRSRLADLDPLLDLDRLRRLIAQQRSRRRSTGVA